MSMAECRHDVTVLFTAVILLFLFVWFGRSNRFKTRGVTRKTDHNLMVRQYFNGLGELNSRARPGFRYQFPLTNRGLPSDELGHFRGQSYQKLKIPHLP